MSSTLSIKANLLNAAVKQREMYERDYFIMNDHFVSKSSEDDSYVVVGDHVLEYNIINGARRFKLHCADETILSDVKIHVTGSGYTELYFSEPILYTNNVLLATIRVSIGDIDEKNNKDNNRLVIHRFSGVVIGNRWIFNYPFV